MKYLRITALLIGSIITFNAYSNSSHQLIRHVTVPIEMIPVDHKTPTLAQSVGSGTGIVLKPGYVLTAAHLTSQPRILRINGAIATIVKRDDDQDLMLLHVPGQRCPCVSVSKENGRIDQQIKIAGFPLYAKYNTLFIVDGYVQGKVREYQINSGAGAQGSSGGGVFIVTPLGIELNGTIQAIGTSVQHSLMGQYTVQHEWIIFSSTASSINKFLSNIKFQ